MRPHSTCDQMKWYRISICFVRLLSPALRARETAPRLSMFRTDGEASVIPSSQSRSLNHTTSCTAGVAPTYSASVDDSATIVWSLLLQLTAPPPIIHTNPDVERLVSTHPAQSESQNPCIELSVGRIPTPREYPRTLPIEEPSVLYRIMRSEVPFR